MDRLLHHAHLHVIEGDSYRNLPPRQPSCALCHGNGPSPVFIVSSFDEEKAVVAHGKGKMPPLQLSLADLGAVARYTASSNRNQPWFGPTR